MNTISLCSQVGRYLYSDSYTIIPSPDVTTIEPKGSLWVSYLYTYVPSKRSPSPTGPAHENLHHSRTTTFSSLGSRLQWIPFHPFAPTVSVESSDTGRFLETTPWSSLPLDPRHRLSSPYKEISVHSGPILLPRDLNCFDLTYLFLWRLWSKDLLWGLDE